VLLQISATTALTDAGVEIQKSGKNVLSINHDREHAMGAYQIKKSVKVLREELYEKVWRMAMWRLAAQYGVSGPELAKVCKRLNVPRPPVGYWAKLEAKKPVQILPLPPAAADTPEYVFITPTTVNSRASLATVKKKHREQYQATLRGLPSISVPHTMDDPHPFVRLWLADHDKTLEIAKRHRNISPPKHAELDHRRYRILDTLFKELEHRGIKIQATQYQGQWAQIGQERVDFRLSQKMWHVQRPLTTEEKKDWFYARRHSIWEEVPTGRLTFKIVTRLGTGIPVKWTDYAPSPLEQRLREIVAVFMVAGPLLAEERRLREKEWQRCEMVVERRRQKMARKMREHSRWIRFLELAAQWRKANDARQFLAKLEIGLSEGEASYGRRTHADWLMWAREHLKAYDPLGNGIETIWRDLADIPLQYPSEASLLAELDM
jgi:hypothetical protein